MGQAAIFGHGPAAQPRKAGGSGLRAKSEGIDSKPKVRRIRCTIVSSAWCESGTMCGSRIFMRLAGMTHSLSSELNSVQRAQLEKCAPKRSGWYQTGSDIDTTIKIAKAIGFCGFLTRCRRYSQGTVADTEEALRRRPTH